MSRPVVVGVEGTADALRAVRWAAAHADLHGAGLRIAHAVERRHNGATQCPARGWRS